jgi:hypothetical protein
MNSLEKFQLMIEHLLIFKMTEYEKLIYFIKFNEN